MSAFNAKGTDLAWQILGTEAGLSYNGQTLLLLYLAHYQILFHIFVAALSLTDPVLFLPSMITRDTLPNTFLAFLEL